MSDMQPPIWCELVCRECAQTTAGRFAYKRLPKREMRSFAKAGGWTIDVDGDWLCQACTPSDTNGVRSPE